MEGLMPDDPMDPVDATWIPPEKKIVWCPVHQEPAESCECGREQPSCMAFVIVLIFAILGCLSLVVGAFVGL